MIDELFQYLHLNSVTSDDTYKAIVCCLTNEIIKLKLELSEYKAFHLSLIHISEPTRPY